MDFDDIIKRESKTDELDRQFKKVQLDFDLLFETFYSESKLNNLKEKMKQKLLKEFENFFKKLGFNVKVSSDSKLESKTATLGKYSVEISINKSFTIFLEVQHKNNFGIEEYGLSMDLSSKSEFESCIIENHSYSVSQMIELRKKDIISLNKIIKENKPLEIVCKFEDGQSLDIFKEYTSFEDIIKDIPDEK